MSLLNRRRVLLAKIETTYGTDASPGNADAVLIQQAGLMLKPLEGAEVSRDLIRPYFGSNGKIKVENFATLEFSVELAGSGTAGTPPAYGYLLRACGLAETIVGAAITGNTITPISDPYSVRLDASASSIDSFHNGMEITLTASGERRYITSYNGTSKEAKVSSPLTLNPAAGLAYTISKNVSYSPISINQESVTLYFNMDGVRHVMLGCRGTLSTSFEVKKIPALKFKFTGLLGTISDQALPAADFSDYIAPLPVNNANTGGFQLFNATSAALQVLNFDLANTVVYRHLVGSESVIITDRQTTGNVTIEANPVASYDWFSAAKNKTRGVMSIAHGAGGTHGHIITLSANQVEVGAPNYGDMDGIAMMSMPMDFIAGFATGGNDEFKLTFL